MSLGYRDLVRVTLSTTGAGSTLTINAAVAGWLSFAGALATNGDTYACGIIDGNNSELSTFVYNSGTNTLSGRTVLASTNGGLALNLTSNAILAITIPAEWLVVGGPIYGTMAGQSAAAVAITGGSLAGLTSVGIGTTSPQSVLDAVTTSAAAIRGILSEQISSDAGAAQINLLKYRGIPSSLTAVTNGDFTGTLASSGYDGTSLIRAATMAFKVNGTVSTGNVPTDIAFSTGATGTLTERMRLWSSGGFGINTASDPGLGNFFVGGNVASTGTVTDSGAGFLHTGTPVYGGGLASSFLATLNSSTQTVAASNTFNGFRLSTVSGADIVFTTQASAVAIGHYASLTASASSSASSSVYGGGFHAQNAGPGTVRGAHMAGFGLTGSTGVVAACALDLVPVSTNVSGYGAYFALNSSGANNANTTAFAIESPFGDVLTYGILGGGVTLLPVNTAFMQWNQHTSTASGAVFLRMFTPASTLAFQVDKNGNSFTLGSMNIGDRSAAVHAGVFGNGSGAGGGAQFFIQAGATNNFLLGNQSAVWGKDRNGNAANFDGLGVMYGALDLAIMPQNWCYFSGFQNGIFNTNHAPPTHPSGMAIGWNQSGGIGETNLVANIDSGSGPWDFIFQDWDGTTLSSLAYINKGGGLYIPSTLSQTLVGGGYGTGTFGTTPTPGVAGTADTFFAAGLFSSDSTARTVAYNTSGVLLGNALQTTLFIGNTSAGTSDPTPQGSTQGLQITSIKSGATAGTASVYGQTGGLIIVCMGGWAGTSGTTFDVSGVTLSTGSKTITVSAAPTNHKYVPGMPVVFKSGTGSLAASTVIVSVGVGTVTLSAFPTGNGTATLTFWAGTAITKPVTTTPTVPNGAYNPYTGTPGDTFAINGGVRLYDNGYGLAQFLEFTCETYNLAGTLNIGQRLQVGSTTSGQFDVGSLITSGIHAVGFQSVATSGSGIGFGVFIANGNGSWSDWGASSSGFAFSMTNLSVVSVSEPGLKENIRKLPSAKNVIMAMDPVGFMFGPEIRKHGGRDKDKEFLGFLSKDHGDIRGVENAVADYAKDIFVHHTKSASGYDGYIRDELVPVLWRGVQELWAETGNLLDRMNGLEARVERLEGMAVH